MKYVLQLNQQKHYGQIPVTGPDGTVDYFVLGNLDNPNHTIYLTDYKRQEIGRLYQDSVNLIASYAIDVIQHSEVKVKKVNSKLANVFYLTRLNYWVNGSFKNGSYSFRSGIFEVGKVKTEVLDSGVCLICDIKHPEDVPFLLLSSILFTQWHVTPLKLPEFPPVGLIHYRYQVSNFNLQKAKGGS